MKTRHLIIALLSVFMLVGCGKDTEKIKLFKEKTYMAFFCSSEIADCISKALTDYDRGLRYFRASDATMTGSVGEYCYEPKEVVQKVLQTYNAMKIPEAIGVYVDAAYSNLPKDEEKLKQLYDQAVKMQRLATEPRGTATTFQMQVAETKSTFERLLKESDTDYPDTEIDEQSKQEEALRFIKALSNI